MPDDAHPERIPTVDFPQAEPPSTIDATGSLSTLDRQMRSIAQDPIAPTIPGYAITGELARGGMGLVYAANDLTLEREVAIKTLLPGAPADRFETESKITARLPHPGIPPVHALGRLDDGSPYLVMKLIRGRTLADLLKERASPSDELPRFVSIFEQIAQAVGFAHEQRIIHRDLKPLNVMVGAFGEVQVMDWGLAKALTRDPVSREAQPSAPAPTTGDLSHTTAGAIMGTPGYMSPEQARGEPADARADVFALGAILAAILTGKPAFVGTTARESIEKAARGDLSETIERLEASGADAELVELAKECLAPNPAQRPDDAKQVARRIAEYRLRVEKRLKQAETARAEALVRASEQSKQRRILQRGGAAIVTVLLAGLGVSLWQMDRAIKAEFATSEQLKETIKAEAATASQLKLTEAARADAEERLSFSKRSNEILGSVFSSLNPRAYYATMAELRDALKSNLRKAAKDLDVSAIGDPLAVAEMQNTLAHSLVAFDDAGQATGLLQKVFQTRKARLGPDHPLTLASMNNLADGYRAAGRLDLALPLLEETRTQMKAKLGSDHFFTVACLNNLAVAYKEAGKIDLALPVGEESLKIAKAKLGPDHLDTLRIMSNLGLNYHIAGRNDQALMHLNEARVRMEATLGPAHPDTLKVLSNVAECYRAAGKIDMALPLYEQTLTFGKKRLGPDHSDTIIAMNNLGMGYLVAGKLDLALPLLEESLTRSKATLGSDHLATLTSMTNLAEAYRTAGKLELAMPIYEEARKRLKATLGPDHPSTLTSMHNLAIGYLEVGKLDLALPLLEETLRYRKAKQGHDHPSTLKSMNVLAGYYWSAKRLDRSIPLFEELLRLEQAKLGRAHPDTLHTAANLGKNYMDAGRIEDALPLLEEGHRFAAKYPNLRFATGNWLDCLIMAGMRERAQQVIDEQIGDTRKRHPSGSLPLASEMSSLATAALKLNDFAKAEQIAREAFAIRRQKEPESWTTFNTQSLLGGALLGQKKYAEAEPLLLKGYEGMKQREKSIPRAGMTRIPEALDRLIELYTATNKPEEVKKWKAERAKYPAAAKVGGTQNTKPSEKK